MSKLKVLNRNVVPSQTQMVDYHKNNNRMRPTKNLRFGKIVVLSDQDLDG